MSLFWQGVLTGVAAAFTPAVLLILYGFVSCWRCGLFDRFPEQQQTDAEGASEGSWLGDLSHAARLRVPGTYDDMIASKHDNGVPHA